jgi:hypothetical protein
LGVALMQFDELAERDRLIAEMPSNLVVRIR